MAIRITNKTSTSFTVEWDQHFGAVANYNIEVYRGSESSSNLSRSAYGIGSNIRSYGITGLSPSTYYVVKLYSRNSSGDAIKVEYSYPTTEAPPLPLPDPIGSISFSNITQTGFNASWTGGYGATHYGVELYEGYDSYPTWSNYEYSATSIGVSGRKPNTRYVLKVYGRNSSGNGQSVSREVYTLQIPAPSTPSFNTIQNSEGSTSVIVYWYASSNTNYYEIECYRVGYMYPVQSYTEYGTSRRFDNLILGESYYFRLRAIGDGGSSSWVQSSTVQLGYARPREFSWTYSKTSGSNFKLTASEWNDFCKRINDFRRYKNPKLGDVSFSSATDGQDFRAAQFNQARDAISAISPNTSPPAQQSKDGIVYASLLNSIVTSLNSVWR